MLKAKTRQSAKKDPDRYLIIGFDSEYQLVVTGDNSRLENEVLSYQFSCVVVERVAGDVETRWRGLLKPKGPKVEDRLSLEDFVSAAIQQGMAEHPEISVPSFVYLVAHFTRADLPGFINFKDEQMRSKMNLQNIRNNFMNIGEDIAVEVPLLGKVEPLLLKVQIRDTITLSPTGSKKLSDIGDILGLEKIVLADTPEGELSIISNMKDLMVEDWDLFYKYAIRDAEIVTDYALRIIRLYQSRTDKFKLPVTLTSIGVDLITKFWKDQNVDPLEICGKEQIVEKFWSKKNNRYQTKKRVAYKRKIFWNLDFFTECYHGGRNEQFWFGPAFEDVWYDYDLSSAYPSAMALIGNADWDSCRPIRDTRELLEDYKHADLAFANVDFEFPSDIRFPVLPVRTENGLIFPKSGNCTTHISEILLAKSLGCKIKLVEGRYIPSGRHGNYEKGIPRPIRPFDGFTKYCIEQRKQFLKGTLDNLFWKELVNSTYGKTAQGLRVRRIYDLRDQTTKPLEESKITNPVYAAFITAFCRGVLGEIMNALPRDVAVFSVTTDGFLTTANAAQMKKAARGTLSKYYMSSRRLLTGGDDIYEIKHIIRKPLGWRTRAQATLCVGSAVDWQKPDETITNKECLVLAKGGIKLTSELSTAAQNIKIVNMFFERTPTETIKTPLGAGIRNMYESGLDFVFNDYEQILSMEYDWKCKPLFAGEAEGVTSSDRSYKHLFFSTTPWENVEQFIKTRAIWEQYNHTDRHCLKSVEDLELFTSFHESQLSLADGVGKYLRKEDGDLKRLRQQLIIAYELRKAGTHKLKPQAFKRSNIFPTYKLKAREVADILENELGIPCSKLDVDNGRKKTIFLPNQVPNTDTVRMKLSMLKRQLFPELRPEEFLSRESEFDIKTVPIDQCPLASRMFI